MNVTDIYNIYRVFRALENPEKMSVPEMRKRIKAASQVLERLCFRHDVPKEMWARLEGTDEVPQVQPG